MLKIKDQSKTYMESEGPSATTAPSSYLMVTGASSVGATVGTAQLSAMQDHLQQMQSVSAVLGHYAQASEKCHQVVRLIPRLSCLPVLIGNDGEPIALYKFVEGLDQVTDYEQMRAEFPTLSYGQISAGIEFLRKLAQFNTRSIDIDELEEDLLESTPEFMAEIERSLDDKEIVRVLAPQQ